MAVAGAQRLVVVLGEQQDRHLEHPRLVLQFVDELGDGVDLDAGLAALAARRSSTTFSRGAISTPSASGVVSSIGFFFAFMMLGSEA